MRLAVPIVVGLVARRAGLVLTVHPIAALTSSVVLLIHTRFTIAILTQDTLAASNALLRHRQPLPVRQSQR